MPKFFEINPKHFDYNVFRLIGDKWGLLSAKKDDGFNMMTVSWGTFGVLWGRNIVNVFVRPQRYTYEFMENSDTFTLCFFDEDYHKSLETAGRLSGRDVDKVKECGFTPIIDGNSVYYEEASYVFLCRKLYRDAFHPEQFVDKTIPETVYPTKDYHISYVGEIERLLVRREEEKIDKILL
ncbi:MAG TPA: flavin reductase family protein [Firmicutes bacterium]|nr:flavin reductase family protein [Bacillota bacterium]